jgi:hypothetical protein
MFNRLKINSTFVWVFAVLAVSIGGFIYLIRSDSPKTFPKIKLSYFQNEIEIAKSVTASLNQDTSQTKGYWIGVEPMKDEQIEVALQLKNELQNILPFNKVIIDQELGWSDEVVKKFGITDWIFVKDNFEQLGQIISQYESEGVRYIVITASLYSNSLLIKNPIRKIKDKYHVQPTTLSFSYLPFAVEDEKNLLFPCDTEDRAGVKDWACLVLNKSRNVRRKIDVQNPKAWVGLMDLSGERDYVLWLNKKT